MNKNNLEGHSPLSAIDWLVSHRSLFFSVNLRGSPWAEIGWLGNQISQITTTHNVNHSQYQPLTTASMYYPSVHFNISSTSISTKSQKLFPTKIQ
jgi:hypothetical protein